MQTLMAHTARRLEDFGRRPLYAFLADVNISPEVRLSFVPHMAHFVMSFADLCTLILREAPPSDRLAEIVNAHADEDDDHWRWYLSDLAKLELDRPQPFSETLRFLWGARTRKTRLLTYRLCRLSMGADPVQKLVVILVMEAAARLGFQHTARVAREMGRELTYFGGQHLDAEEGHTLLTGPVQRALEEVSLDADGRRRLVEVVDTAFDAFTEFVDELYRSID
jgi:hypothetical protein